MFSALRQGSIVYVLDKGDPPKLKIGQVISVTSPNNFNYLVGNTVDISVRTEDQTVEYKQLPGQLSIANYNNGNTIVSESKDLMCQEVESMVRNSRNILDSVPYHEQVIVSCEEMLRELSPQYAKQKDQEEKISNLENKVGSMESKLDNIASMLTKALKV